MRRIEVSLVNCFGIRSLSHTFDFQGRNRRRVYAIYAPNGSMKTSFAKVFDALANNKSPRDEIFPDRSSSASVTDETASPATPESILVLHSYDEKLDTTPQTGTLLANEQLRIEFEQAHASVEEARRPLLNDLRRLSGLSQDNILPTLSHDFEMQSDGFDAALERAVHALDADGSPGYASIRYRELINPKVLEFLDQADVQRQLREYMARFDELISHSKYFRKGTFTHTNARSVAKALKDQAFFKANHYVTLADPEGNPKEIKNEQELQNELENEKARIFNDPELSKVFDELDNRISGHKDLRAFRDVLDQHPEIVAELSDLPRLKQRLWLSYVAEAQDTARPAVETYRKAKAAIQQLVEQARSEQTEWAEVVHEFNRRFKVPFRLAVSNQEDVVLKQETPSVVFRYEDRGESQVVDRGRLLEVLSQGEKRALYLLNVLFELRLQQKKARPTIVIADDIADSFDYRNKYAIVQYLQEIARDHNFSLIVLSHNFDFFRTIALRFGLKDDQALIARSSSAHGVSLVPLPEYRNPLRRWLESLAERRLLLLASLPMVRNLLQYIPESRADDLALATAFIHQKRRTEELTLEDAASLLSRTVGREAKWGDTPFLQALYEEAEQCATSNDLTSLENKVVLSLAIRMKAEAFMLSWLGPGVDAESINSNQTWHLFNKYRNADGALTDAVSVLDRVVLMTPEAIHLNSFMYEPLVDMSHEELAQLYEDVCELTEVSQR